MLHFSFVTVLYFVRVRSIRHMYGKCFGKQQNVKTGSLILTCKAQMTSHITKLFMFLCHRYESQVYCLIPVSKHI